MKQLKIILIIALILNIIVSISLVIYRNTIRQELANLAVQSENEDFKSQTVNIANYVKNGSELLSQYKGNMDNNTISLMVSDFMTTTIPKIAKETTNLTTEDELTEYYNNENIRKLTGIRSNDLEEFYSLVQILKDLGVTDLEFESAEYDSDSITTDGRNTYGVLNIKYKNVEQVLNFNVTVSYTSEYIEFLPITDD